MKLGLGLLLIEDSSLEQDHPSMFLQRALPVSRIHREEEVLLVPMQVVADPMLLVKVHQLMPVLLRVLARLGLHRNLHDC